MDLRKKFGTSRELEQDGVELHLGADAYITLARSGGSNVRFEKATARAYQQHRRAFESSTMDTKKSVELMQEIYAETVILGWRGIELDGEPLPYSRENAAKLMRELPDLWSIVQDESKKLANFQQEEVAELGKASPTH